LSQITGAGSIRFNLTENGEDIRRRKRIVEKEALMAEPLIKLPILNSKIGRGLRFPPATKKERIIRCTMKLKQTATKHSKKSKNSFMMFCV
jgi:hypothetical protein